MRDLDALEALLAAATPGPWDDGEDRTEHGTSYWPRGPSGVYLMAGNHGEGSYGSNRGGSAGRVGPERLRSHIGALLPTPTVKGNHNKAGLSARSGDGLATAVGGTLHPRFVEWMMGLPRDWTRATMTREDAEAKRAMMRSKHPTAGESEPSGTPSSYRSPR